MGGLGVVQSPQSVILHVQILLTSFDTSTTIDQRKLHTAYTNFIDLSLSPLKLFQIVGTPPKKKKESKSLCKNCIKKNKNKK